MNRLKLIQKQLKASNENKSPDNNLVIIESSKNNPQIKIIRLNNPKQLNSMNEIRSKELYETFIKLDKDEETKVIILTGTEKSFCAGADIKALHKHDFVEMNKNDWNLLHLENIYYHVCKPIIAAINGICFGGGLEIALLCDILIASERAQLSFPEINIGLIPGCGGTQRLVRQIGINRAKEYILTGKKIDLQFAKTSGIINSIVKHENLMEEALKQAEEIAKSPLNSIIAAKKSIRLAYETTLFAGLKAERDLFNSLFNTKDKNIGIEAVLNKKQLKFLDK